jgi:2-keto-4-pentenoate hydratase/2-oxohepta-3-ene-1,7-dioic acid hydratase in catechol pathway
MKLVRFSRSDSSIGWGLKTEDGVQDVLAADPSLPNSVVELISRWSHFESRIAGLARKLGSTQDTLQLLCPIDRPGKILCIGLNYRDHALETKAAIPTEPVVFCKMPTAMIGPLDAIRLPSVSAQVDYEAELVVVIGQRIKHGTASESERAIFGYSVGHDVSARDWQKGKPGGQWFLGKSFDTFAPLGPAIALASSIPDAGQLLIQSWLNGELMQHSNTRELIFTPAYLVQYLSQVMTLEPGDVIYTGTPSGVGVARTPPRFLHPGDTIEIEIESIGRLVNSCIADT